MGISTLMASRQAHGGVGGENSFGYHAAHAGDNVRQLAPRPSSTPDAAVAREASGAGEHQVAKSGEASHGVRAGAAGNRSRVISAKPRVMSAAIVL